MKKAIKFLNKLLDGLTDEFGLPLEEGIKDSVSSLEHCIFILEEEEKNSGDDPRFDTFYAHYPLKKSKAPARKAFAKLNPDAELYQKIMDAVTAQKASRQWQQKQYIPHPSTWLNQERWEDEVDTVDGLPTDDKYKGI